MQPTDPSPSRRRLRSYPHPRRLSTDPTTEGLPAGRKIVVTNEAGATLRKTEITNHSLLAARSSVLAQALQAAGNGDV